MMQATTPDPSTMAGMSRSMARCLPSPAISPTEYQRHIVIRPVTKVAQNSVQGDHQMTVSYHLPFLEARDDAEDHAEDQAEHERHQAEPDGDRKARAISAGQAARREGIAEVQGQYSFG